MPLWSALVQLITDGLLWANQATGNAGIAIILFTLFIRTLLLPLTLPALRNARRQQELAPRVREIQKRHGKDRAAATQEQMELYRQHGFNPMAGCLPLILQTPIFLALWRAISSLGESHQALGGFLYLSTVTAPDSTHILPIVAGLAQFLQSRMAMPPKKDIVDPQQQQMNQVMQFMPLMVVVFGWNIAAGAVLYWTVSSIFSAVLQFFVTGWGSLRDLLPFLPERHVKSLLPAPDPARLQNRKPSFMQRMQDKMIEAQRQQSGAQPSPQVVSDPVLQSQSAPAPEHANGDSRVTEDGWRLPGAPGSTGRTAYATGGPASPPAPSLPDDPRQRNRGRRKRRR